VIDTATPYLYVALYEDTNKIDGVYREGNNDHSVTLMDTIETMFKEHDWTVESLDAVIVGTGPGSYTGVRIGTVVAKMFAWSHEIPLYSVSTLALLASGASEGTVLAYVDARRQMAFAGLFQKTGDTLTRLKEDFYGDLATILSMDHDHSTNVQEPNLNVLLNSDLLRRIDNVHELVPTYLRRTEAERNKGKTK